MLTLSMQEETQYYERCGGTSCAEKTGIRSSGAGLATRYKTNLRYRKFECSPVVAKILITLLKIDTIQVRGWYCFGSRLIGQPYKTIKRP